MIVPGTLSLHGLPYGNASVIMIVSASDELCDSNGWRSSLAGTLNASSQVRRFTARSHWNCDPVPGRELVQP